jgi:esterase/lipase
MSDVYMRAMYSEVSINLNHLASRLILMEMDRGRTLVECDQFHRTLYLALKNTQREPAIHLHRGLRNPEAYDRLLDGRCASLDQFISSTSQLGLVDRQENGYHFLPKLRQEHDFDQIRMENPIVVYANEMAPIRGAWHALQNAGEAAAGIDDKELARLRLDDEIRAYAWDKKKFASGKYGQINDQETATEDGTPYLIVPPEGGNGLGIVLVHGFLASPAELRELGERIAAAGHPVIGVRLKGHGTSPHDLLTRSWEEWLDSVRRGYEILSPFAERICIVGFSTGGSLALIHAAQEPEKLAGVAVASAPLKFRNKSLIFVPLLHGANKLAEWMPATENLMPFRKNESEHPHINYRHIPIRGLHELRRVTAEMNRRLKEVTCPALIIQGDADTVVDPHSADLIERKLASPDKTLHMMASDRHGILNENIGGAQDLVLAFLERLTIGTDGLSAAPTREGAAE